MRWVSGLAPRLDASHDRALVPVRYWPKDGSLVEVDRDAMVAKVQAHRAEGRAGLIRMAEERLDKGGS